MKENNLTYAAILGGFIFLGLTANGFFIGNAAIEYKLYDRSVKVKGLSEREQNADVIIWPIQYSIASNKLDNLYESIEKQTKKITVFLQENGIEASEITIASPAITDKSAQRYSHNLKAEFRFAAVQTVTVYSQHIDIARTAMNKLSELGKQGIVFTGGNHQSRTEYIFTSLNKVKPEMIAEATKNAREVAQKFATDSESKLGKIKRASQGQFSIMSRDKNNPHIKRIRVVSTIEYYLSD